MMPSVPERSLHYKQLFEAALFKIPRAELGGCQARVLAISLFSSEVSGATSVDLEELDFVLAEACLAGDSLATQGRLESLVGGCAYPEYVRDGSLFVLQFAGPDGLVEVLLPNVHMPLTYDGDYGSYCPLIQKLHLMGAIPRTRR